MSLSEHIMCPSTLSWLRQPIPAAIRSSIPVQACLKTDTHYCDICAETPFFRACIDELHEEAQAKHIKIVCSCGFDSVPVDISTLLAVQHLKQAHGQVAEDVCSVLPACAAPHAYVPFSLQLYEGTQCHCNKHVIRHAVPQMERRTVCVVSLSLGYAQWVFAVLFLVFLVPMVLICDLGQ